MANVFFLIGLCPPLRLYHRIPPAAHSGTPSPAGSPPWGSKPKTCSNTKPSLQNHGTRVCFDSEILRWVKLAERWSICNFASYRGGALWRLANFPCGPHSALVKIGARRQTHLAVSSTGRASACLPGRNVSAAQSATLCRLIKSGQSVWYPVKFFLPSFSFKKKKVSRRSCRV